MNLYPDDHRCSDQETDGGLCGCMMIQSGSEEEQEMSDETPQKREEDNSYTRRLFLARNRKILQQQSVHTRTSSLDDHASVSTTQPGQSTLPTRSVASDPIDKTMDDDEIIGAFPFSSPPQKQPLRYSPSKSLKASTSTYNGTQSAARKSISNVYERLLREEEERRESERVRKEQARQRRRVERLRKQEDSEMLARLISSSSNNPNAKDMIENGDEMQMPPYTSPILAVSPPSTRDVSLDLRMSLLQNEDGEMDEIHHANGHLHPAHAFARSTNAAKLAAVRAANMIEETRENENSTPSITIPSLGLAPAFAQDGKMNGSAIKAEEQYSSSPLNASPASSVDSVHSWTFPNRISPTASPQLLSPNLNTFSPQDNNQSSSSPRRNRHRRGTHGEGGVSQVLSLSARVPSLNAAKTAAKVKKELYSPDPDLPNSPGQFSLLQEEEDEVLAAGKTNEDFPVSQSKRRVSFSPKPEFITTFTPVTEESEEEEEGGSFDNYNAEDSIPTIRIPDEIVEEVTEGSENSRVTDVPLQSTPPRKKRDSQTNSTMNASSIGDDSLRLTLEQLNKFLKDREEKKDLTSILQLPPDDTIKSEPEKTNTLNLSITELTDSSKDEEYVRQLDEARERLNRIARSYTGMSNSSNSAPPKTTSNFKIGLCLIGFCIVQFGLAILMNAAAQAKAEEMYLTMHYGYLGGIEDILLFETQSKSSLFAPLFSKWGILPDLGRLAVGDRDELLNDWISTFRWIFKTAWQYKTIWQPIRFTFAKLAYSLGLYGVNTVPIGGMIPS